MTGAFLHDPANPLHIFFNMYILYWLGTMLEPIARARALRRAVLRVAARRLVRRADRRHRTRLTVGASGAVFGLMAAAFVFQRARGIDPWRSGLGPVILFNLALPFLFPNLNISIGGHIGGLIGGAIAALSIEWLGSRRKGDLLPVMACVLVAAVSIAGGIAVSLHERSTLPVPRGHLLNQRR